MALTLLSPLVFWGEIVKMARYLSEIYSPSGLIYRVLLGFAMLAVVYAGIKAVKGEKRVITISRPSSFTPMAMHSPRTSTQPSF